LFDRLHDMRAFQFHELAYRLLHCSHQDTNLHWLYTGLLHPNKINDYKLISGHLCCFSAVTPRHVDIGTFDHLFFSSLTIIVLLMDSNKSQNLCNKLLFLQKTSKTSCFFNVTLTDSWYHCYYFSLRLRISKLIPGEMALQD